MSRYAFGYGGQLDMVSSLGYHTFSGMYPGEQLNLFPVVQSDFYFSSLVTFIIKLNVDEIDTLFFCQGCMWNG